MNAPIKPKIRMSYPGAVYVKKKLDFESTNGTIQTQDDNDDEVTSKYRPLKK
jgi:hypothetical protein